MPTDQEVIETIRAVLAQYDADEGIHTDVMAVIFARVLEEFGDRRNPKQLQAAIRVEAAKMGVRAIDAPH
jgi:hypothetical protein